MNIRISLIIIISFLGNATIHAQEKSGYTGKLYEYDQDATTRWSSLEI